MSEVAINGKVYSMWNGFVDRKAKWIGGTLVEILDGTTDQIWGTTEIVDIQLNPSGSDTAYFTIHGKEFTCGFGVKYGGIGGNNLGEGIRFHVPYAFDFIIRLKPGVKED